MPHRVHRRGADRALSGTAIPQPSPVLLPPSPGSSTEGSGGHTRQRGHGNEAQSRTRRDRGATSPTPERRHRSHRRHHSSSRRRRHRHRHRDRHGDQVGDEADWQLPHGGGGSRTSSRRDQRSSRSSRSRRRGDGDRPRDGRSTLYPAYELGKRPSERNESDVGVIWQWISQHPSHSEVMGVNPAFSEATKALCLNATVTKVPEGSVLFQQGQPGACAYLLLKGTCDIRFTPRLMEAYAAHAGAQRGDTASGLHALLRGTGTRQPRSRRSPRSGHGGEKEGSLNVGGLTPQQLDDAVGPTMMHMTAGAVIGDSAALISSMAYTAASRANGTSERACTVIATSACELLRVSHRVFRACTESAPQTMELQDLVLGLAEMQVFRSWSPTELTFLAKWTSQQEYRSGEVIFEEGSEVTSVCFLLRGEVVLKSRRHVSKPSANSKLAQLLGDTSSKASPAVEVEHFTPPAVLGEHELVLATMKRKKQAQAKERAKRARRGSAFSPTTLTAAGEATDQEETLHRMYTAAAAARCIVASIPALVFRRLVLEHGSGSMLGALEEGGFVPALAILGRFAADRERWHKVVTTSLRRDGMERNHAAISAKHIQKRFIRCHKCGQQGHASTQCGSAPRDADGGEDGAGAAPSGDPLLLLSPATGAAGHETQPPKRRHDGWGVRHGRGVLRHSSFHSHSTMASSDDESAAAHSHSSSHASSGASATSITLRATGTGLDHRRKTDAAKAREARHDLRRVAQGARTKRLANGRRGSDRSASPNAVRRGGGGVALPTTSPHARSRTGSSKVSPASLSGSDVARSEDGVGLLGIALLPGRASRMQYASSESNASSATTTNRSDVARRKLADREHDALAAALSLLNATPGGQRLANGPKRPVLGAVPGGRAITSTRTVAIGGGQGGAAKSQTSGNSVLAGLDDIQLVTESVLSGSSYSGKSRHSRASGKRTVISDGSNGGRSMQSSNISSCTDDSDKVLRGSLRSPRVRGASRRHNRSPAARTPGSRGSSSGGGRLYIAKSWRRRRGVSRGAVGGATGATTPPHRPPRSPHTSPPHSGDMSALLGMPGGAPLKTPGSGDSDDAASRDRARGGKTSIVRPAAETKEPPPPSPTQAGVEDSKEAMAVGVGSAAKARMRARASAHREPDDDVAATPRAAAAALARHVAPDKATRRGVGDDLEPQSMWLKTKSFHAGASAHHSRHSRPRRPALSAKRHAQSLREMSSVLKDPTTGERVLTPTRPTFAAPRRPHVRTPGGASGGSGSPVGAVRMFPTRRGLKFTESKSPQSPSSPNLSDGGSGNGGGGGTPFVPGNRRVATVRGLGESSPTGGAQPSPRTRRMRAVAGATHVGSVSPITGTPLMQPRAPSTPSRSGRTRGSERRRGRRGMSSSPDRGSFDEAKWQIEASGGGGGGGGRSWDRALETSSARSAVSAGGLSPSSAPHSVVSEDPAAVLARRRQRSTAEAIAAGSVDGAQVAATSKHTARLAGHRRGASEARSSWRARGVS